MGAHHFDTRMFTFLQKHGVPRISKQLVPILSIHRDFNGIPFEMFNVYMQVLIANRNPNNGRLFYHEVLTFACNDAHILSRTNAWDGGFYGCHWGDVFARGALFQFFDPLLIVSVKNEDPYRILIRPHGYTR
jgi:hypothetical protein